MCTCPSSPLEVAPHSSIHSSDDAIAAVVTNVTADTTIVAIAVTAVCNTIAVADRKGFHSSILHRTPFHRRHVVVIVSESRLACHRIETFFPCCRGRCRRP